VKNALVVDMQPVDSQLEEWKVTPHYENYEVSTFGRVRRIKGYNFAGIKYLKLIPCKTTNYYGVSLSAPGIKSKSIKVHSLVAMAFLNHKPDRTNRVVVDHIDNNPLNNMLSNLRLLSNRDNSVRSKVGSSGHRNIKVRGNSWTVTFYINKKESSYGSYDSLEKALIRRAEIIEKLIINQ
jgi:hypothetical protein